MADTSPALLCRTIRLFQALLVLLPVHVAAQPVSEYELKAAFVYNFALFTDWPANATFADGILNICVNPASNMRRPLAGLGEKPVKGVRIAVRPLATLDDLHTCHVLFVDSRARDRWAQIKKRLAGASVLTVSDDHDLSHNGTIVGMEVENSRIVFDIDTGAAKTARLVLSSKLLRLARSVK